MCRERPQYPDEGDDLEHGIDKAESDVCAVIAKQARVLLDSLVRIAAIGAGEAQLVHPHGLQPLGQKKGLGTMGIAGRVRASLML
jgi:hypothetical protein